MLEHLFGSKTRVGLLRTFFRQPDKPFFVRELARVLNVQINAIRRELDLLSRLGLLKETAATAEAVEEKTGESGSQLRKYYSLQNNFILYSELQSLLIKSHLWDEQELTNELIDKAGKIQLFVLTGKFTADKRSPVDILLVGDLKDKTVVRVINKFEKKFGFSIRYTIMSRNEFFERRQMMDKFLYSVFEADKMKVVDRLGV